MKWTSKAPSEYGWYWVKEETYPDTIVEVFILPGHKYLCYWDHIYEDYKSVLKMQAQWAGPIEVPNE